MASWTAQTLPLKNYTPKVVYHTPCHMEKMGWALYTLELLRLIQWLELTVLDLRCCGIAGTRRLKRVLRNITGNWRAAVPPD